MAVWSFIHLSRLSTPVNINALMTEEHYPQSLQFSLDDTEGATRERYSFEPCIGQDYVGTVKLKRTNAELPVYDSDGLAPDLSASRSSRFWFFWVRAATAWSKGEKILRPIKLHELFAVWDFEGKLECQGKSHSQGVTLLQQRLYSPPGKLSRLLAHHLLSARAEYFDNLDGTEQLVPSNAALRSADVPFKPLEDLAEVRAEAACPDDAEIDLSIWADVDETPLQAKARSTLRRFAVKWWAHNHTRKASAWLAEGDRDKFDHMAVKDGLRRIKACRYFKWVRGSRIFFWLIPNDKNHNGWCTDFRDGVQCLQLPSATLPTGAMRNIPTETREQELLTREKIFRLRFNWYLEKERVKLVIPRFTVPKATDVRVVWDSKANGHNACLWAPSFILGDFGDLQEITVKWLSVPVDTYLKMGSPDQDYTQEATTFIKSWQIDIDVGQQFNNFAAHYKDRPYLGVRMIDTNNNGSTEREWFMRFSALHFGGRCSPYIACMGQQRILELARGQPDDLSSPFHFVKVVLNLPTSMTWDPSLPRVMRISKDGELASAQVDYVDDIHPTARGIDDTNATLVAKYLKSRMNSLGNQADDKKYRRPTCRPGAWKGEIMHTDQPLPRKSTTVKKWTRFKDGLTWVIEQSRLGSTVPTSELRRIAGLGINVTDVYRDARCYLKGFFNAIEAFRMDRDADGWRTKLGVDLLPSVHSEGTSSENFQLPPSQESDAMEAAEGLELNDSGTAVAANGYPTLTKITSELLDHCEALLELFDSELPRADFVRPAFSNSYRYYVGDASREGVGGATQYPDLNIRGRRGVWEPSFAEGGSNLREAQGQVNHLIQEVRAGLHDGCEVWAFTDNACWSAVWLKGLSTAKHLFKLVLRLKIECRIHEVYLHVCHISGNRMIESGVDGWSRGDFETGVSLGYDLRTFLPLSRSCIEVAGTTLIPWLRSWLGKDFSGLLTPEDWFWKGHLPGVHVWVPPPGAALIALKQLSRSKPKRPHELTHIVMIPRLLYWEEWQSRFEKEMDVWFAMHTGEIWPHFAHEPLIVGISFPLYRSYPWLLRLESEKVVGIGRALSEMSKTSHVRIGDYLRKLWRDPRALPEV